MRAPLSIAVAQPQIVAYDVAANVRAHATAVRAAKARVVIFPELSLTGYELDAPVVDPRDPLLAPLVVACAETGSIALAGAPVAGDDGRVHIGILAVDRTGARIVYAKNHLGSAEAGRFSPGSTPAVLEVDGWRLGLAVCRDTGIAAHAADTAALGVDAYVAGVLEFAEDADVPDQRARRIAAAHRIWVAMASFAGSTGGGYDRAAGGSGVWTPDGSPVRRAGERPGEIVRAMLVP